MSDDPLNLEYLGLALGLPGGLEVVISEINPQILHVILAHAEINIQVITIIEGTAMQKLTGQHSGQQSGCVFCQ